MTFKSILFCLFLYVCLVWVGASYFYSGPDVVHFGLLGTGVGLAAVLLLIILARLFGWARLFRAKAAAKPKKPAQKTVVPVHEDDAAMMALLNDASATLGKMRGAPDRKSAPLSGMPVYLLIGPEGSGKTSTFLNAGLEPQLLAGQPLGSGPPASTRFCNIWLAQEKIFIEIGGSAFSGDIQRWRRLLRLLQVKPSRSKWQDFWNDPEPGLDFRAAVAFCDVKQFVSANSPQGRDHLERECQFWQERLGALAETLAFECPIYVLITKCDAIPYFEDYFRRFADTDAGQVLGCFLGSDVNQPLRTPEADSKKLTNAFNALFYSLADRRITQLAQEPELFRRPSIYEFPRELKRIRPALVQLLTIAFRPHPLRPSPKLLGYYFSGIAERNVGPSLAETTSRWSETQSAPLDATRLFRAGATQILRPGGNISALERGGGGGMQRRWLFVSELFQSVIPAARPKPAVQIDGRDDRLREALCIATCAVCLILCTLFLKSWIGNLGLLHSARSTATIQNPGGPPTLADLQSLEDLRTQIGQLVSYEREGPPLDLRWGLYSGDRLLAPMKETYFRRFQILLLDPLNAALTGRLAALPANPAPGSAYNPVFRSLKAHLMISSGVCRVEPQLVTSVLESTRDESMPSQDSAWQSLANRQIEFYASELRSGNPCKLTENLPARDRARQYLMNFQGVDRIYNGIFAAAQAALQKPQRLTDLAPAYTQVLSGPNEVAGVFSPEGWAFVEKASQNKNVGIGGDSCVFGDGGDSSAGKHDRDTQLAIQRLFIRDYVDRWRTYLNSFSVAHYSSADDAARKLDILSGHKSPMLALLALASNQTDFHTAAAEPKAIDRVAPLVKKWFPSMGAKAASPNPQGAPHAQEAPSSPADIARAFQPVQWVVPAGSETWVVEKNNPYIDALAALGHSMQDIARANTAADQATASQSAAQNYDKALDAARQIARGFEPVGVGGMDVTLERLLEAPIRQTQSFIVTDPEGVEVAKINGQVHGVCQQLRATFRKYPFQVSGPDATLEEVAGLFAPNTGAIWKFQSQSLGELTAKDGRIWKAKDLSKKPQVTPEMLNFLNRAESLTDAFYPAGSTVPQLTYTLRPKLDPSFKDAVVEFDVDGQTHVWDSSLQKQFVWPAPAGSKEIGVKGSIRLGAIGFPFTSRAGAWAIFRVMGDAEPRAISSRIVEWREIRGGDGRMEQITAPVRLEFVDFPGGVDLFNPKFFQDLQCPAKAVE